MKQAFLCSLFLSLIFSPLTTAAPIFGFDATADGSFGGAGLSSVLGSHNDTFIQIDSGTSVTVTFEPGLAALADTTTAPDLRIHTFDQPAPVNGEIFISADGVSFTSLGIFSDANPSNVIDFDLDALGFTHVVAVRVTDVSGTTNGFDLDAVEGFSGGPIPNPVPEAQSWQLVVLGMFGLLGLYHVQGRSSV